MIALDTNVLVRFLVEDDAAQTRRAKSLIQKTQATTTCYISDVVVCELVWVLTSCYRVPRAEIAETLRRLTTSRQMTFDATDRITRALDAFTAGRGDFADYLLREHARTAGCETVATFDRVLLNEPGYSAP